MKNVFLRPLFLVLAACCLLAACGKDPYNYDFQRFSRPPLIRPRADKALVMFYRSYSVYPLVNFYVNDGSKRIGGLANGTYFFQYADPGRHLYWAQVDFRGELVLDAEAGKTYYLKCDITMDNMGMPHKPEFREIDGETAPGDIAKLTYALVH